MTLRELSYAITAWEHRTWLGTRELLAVAMAFGGKGKNASEIAPLLIDTLQRKAMLKSLEDKQKDLDYLKSIWSGKRPK
jgi:predicted transcriptional regulator